MEPGPSDFHFSVASGDSNPKEMKEGGRRGQGIYSPGFRPVGSTEAGSPPPGTESLGFLLTYRL